MKNLFKKQSLMGYTLKVIGIVVMAWGIIQGFIYLDTFAQMGGNYMDEWGEVQHSNVITGAVLFGFIGILARHFLYGVLIIGFGEVIDFLQKIYFKLDPKAEQEWVKEQESKAVVNIPPADGDAPYWVRSDLKPYYEEQGMTVHTIDQTIDPYVFKISLEDRVEYVAMSNKGPRVLTEEEAEKYK